MTTNPKIFVSVGRVFTPEQDAFLTAFEKFLTEHGLAPQIVNRTVFSAGQPLKFIESLMNECSGTVVLAFERLYIREGQEKRGSEAEKPLQEIKVPTVWNQIEAAMAYVLKHPILVVVEKGMRNDGLLEAGYDWYVFNLELDPAKLSDREFVGVFSDWKARVLAYRPSRPARGRTKPKA